LKKEFFTEESIKLRIFLLKGSICSSKINNECVVLKGISKGWEQIANCGFDLG